MCAKIIAVKPRSIPNASKKTKNATAVRISGDKIGMLLAESASSLKILFCLESAIAPNVPNMTDTKVEIPATNNVFKIGSLNALDVKILPYHLKVKPVNTIKELYSLKENIIIDMSGIKTIINTV